MNYRMKTDIKKLEKKLQGGDKLTSIEIDILWNNMLNENKNNKRDKKRK